MARGLSSELDAVFAMPGLEQIAAPLEEYVPRTGDATALVGYLAARAAAGSANRLDDELSDDRVWSRIRAFAADHGRRLPAAPPTFNKLHHLRARIDKQDPGRLDEVLIEMNDAFIEESVKLAKSGGLLDPSKVQDLRYPSRSNTLYADGTWWEPLSKVRRDPETGALVHPTRSKGVLQPDGTWWTEPGQVVDRQTGEITEIPSKPVQGPRVAETLTTTKHGQVLVGVPFVMVGVHGEEAHERVVLGLRRFVSPRLPGTGGETPAADELLARVIGVTGAAAPWCVYDMAFRGENLRKLAQLGVVGIAAMPSASVNHDAVILTDEGPIRYNNDPRKQLLVAGSIRNYAHRVPGCWCDHALTAVDGGLRTHDPSRRVTLSDPLCPVIELRFEEARHGKQRLLATFEVPCEHEPVLVTLDLTARVEGTSTLMLNRLRAISEYDEQFETVKAMRQDVENLNSIMKRAVPLDGQATSLKPAHFELDVLGSALWVNSKFWDIHVARASRSAQKQLLLEVQRAQRQRRSLDVA